MVRVAILAILFWLSLSPVAMAQTRLLVFAAASLKNVMQEAGKQFEQRCHCTLVFSFASSGTLARQIRAGAPAHVFISADTRWMDWLSRNRSISDQTIRMIAGNRLVIAVSKDSGLTQSEPATPESIPKILDVGRIAMAEPDSVPAGRYGKQALQTSGLWQKLSGKIVYGENVRVALALVARGDVNAAIVYFSDARIEPRVKIAYIFDKGSHDQIRYPAGLVETTVAANQAKATEFMDYLTSRSAQRIFQEFGFTAGADD